ISATSEVILSAGALQSPHLLQLSGIGPAAELERVGIQARVDSPEVGANLQDHYQIRVMVKMNDGQSLNRDVRNPLRLAAMGWQWLVNQRGPLTVGAGQVGGVLRSAQARDAEPDILLNVMPLSVDKPGSPMHDFAGFSASVSQCRPDSRGTVMARSNDPLALPRITSNYLTEPHDIRTLVDGIKVLRDIYAQPAFSRYVDSEFLPGKDVTTDAQLEDYTRKNGGTVFHPSATCRMGSDRSAVLDPFLRVNGVRSLRVIDASAMPAMVSTNTNAATIMIAERGAAILTGEILP
ncbi:MAG: GMC oxidoreductase, partial [Burkholderiaceae bacterium]